MKSVLRRELQLAKDEALWVLERVSREKEEVRLKISFWEYRT
jgi:hypothetical protein